MNRLLRLKSVSKYRSMQSWTSSVDLREFAKYNVIFGVNGTGKSTIASLLRDAMTDTAWSSGMEALVQVDDEEQRAVSNSSDPFWGCVRVFNDEYVEANLRFANDTGSTTEPLLVLGEKRVDVEKERMAAKARLEEIAKELPRREKAQRSFEARRDKIATDTARTVSEELQGISPRYAPRSYKAPEVRKLIEGGVPAIADLDVAKELRTVRAQALPECQLPATKEFSVEKLITEIRAALAEKALSVVIDDFAQNPNWSRWVGAGLTLHDDRATCIYCGNLISTDRRHALEAHFDESLQRLQGHLDILTTELESLRRESVQAMAALPQAKLITEEFRPDYEIALKSLSNERDSFVSGIGDLLGELDDKRGHMFSAQEPATSLTVTKLSLEAVSGLIFKHNGYVRDIESHRQEAAKRVEAARVAKVAPDYRKLDTDATGEKKAVADLASERLELERVLRETEVGDLDPLPMADRLTADLSQLLGRSDIAFASDSRGYRILRNSSPATHLCEGERNAISLLYFLRSLEVHDTDKGNCVVVIDDPVSSLDHNSLMGASALLWARLVPQCGQLIMLTHNFELFRIWSYQLTQAKLGRQAFSLYEMRSSVDGNQRRKPVLADWPYDYEMQKRLRSEYHYLFWTVLRTLEEHRVNPTPEREVEAAVFLPNVCRRLLEAFLAFRYPAGVGSLSEQVREIKPGAVDKEVRGRVLRFVHTYSHHEEADISRPIDRPETLDNVRAVMDFVKAIDKEHFCDMCAALGFNHQPGNEDSVASSEK